MNVYPIAMAVLAAELEEMQTRMNSLTRGNETLRNELIALGEQHANLREMKAKEVLDEYEVDVLVELAEDLAPVFGLTKSENYRSRVKEFLENRRI